MLFITFATHLMSVTVVSKHWKHKLPAVFCILLITWLYIVTAVLLANQNANARYQWPSSTPLNGNSNYLVMQAACFQNTSGAVQRILRGSLGKDAGNLATDAFRKSSSNKLPRLELILPHDRLIHSEFRALDERLSLD
jgi:hypothetical protein